VPEIHATLRLERAYNTVLTVMEVLYRKGWLVRRPSGSMPQGPRARRRAPAAATPLP
jgi:hypothetical protein